MNIVLFGNGESIEGIHDLCKLQGYTAHMMNDQNYDTQFLKEADIIVPSPYIPTDHKIFQHYPKKINSLLQFLGQFRYHQERGHNLITIGVAGTKGKSTTSRLLTQLLKYLHLDDTTVWHCGYMRIPVGEVFATIKKEAKSDHIHILVVECSSMMLHDLHDWQFDYTIWSSSKGNILDGFATSDMIEQTKKAMMEHTTKLIVTDQESSKHLPTHLEHKIHLCDPHLDISNTQLHGSHNALNLSSALIVAQHIAQSLNKPITSSQLDLILPLIKPLKHHLIPLRKINEITIYDDNISQEPSDQADALQGFQDPVVLIAMGDMNAKDLTMLKETYQQHVGFAIIHESCPKELLQHCDSRGVAYHCTSTLEDALTIGLTKAEKYNYKTILFSPGGKPSGSAENLFHRGQQFEQLTQSLLV